MSNQISDAIEVVAAGITESVNQGFKTLGQLLQEELAKGGSSEASAFEVTINNGVTRMVVSDSDGYLNTQVAPSDDVQIRKVNTATAGV
jgi:hypothetical protein